MALKKISHSTKRGVILKKILLFITFCILLSCSPMLAVASETPPNTSTETTVTESEKFQKQKRVKIKSRCFIKKNAYLVQWNAFAGADGYQFALCINKSFKSKYKPSKCYLSGTKIHVNSIKKKKTYYYRVRAYKEKSSGKKQFSKWSKVYKIKRKS